PQQSESLPAYANGSDESGSASQYLVEHEAKREGKLRVQQPKRFALHEQVHCSRVCSDVERLAVRFYEAANGFGRSVRRGFETRKTYLAARMINHAERAVISAYERERAFENQRCHLANF